MPNGLDQPPKIGKSSIFANQDYSVKVRAVHSIVMARVERNDYELRVPSIIGCLRYWYRALIGAKIGNDLNALKQAEAKVFGSAERASPFSLRLRKTGHEAIPEKFDMLFQFHYADLQLRKEIQNAVWLLITLGGIGRGVRRGQGSLMRSGLRPFNDIGDFAATLSRDLEAMVQTEPIERPQYPTLHPDYCKIIICNRDPYRSSDDAINDFRKRLKQKRESKLDYEFASVLGDRSHASALHLHIMQNAHKDEYYSVLTAFQTPLATPQKLVKGFVAGWMSEKDGYPVWGI